MTVLGSGPAITRRPRTLVVVEDDEQVRRALARFLRASGYDVRVFESAEDWLAALCPADGAIIDINLPGLSGVDLDDRLRREGLAIPAVFITAHEEAAGVDLGPPQRVVLQKPLKPQAVLEAIDRVLTADNEVRVPGDRT